MTSGPSAVRVAVLFPELLGTYGDSGNAAALAYRIRARGLPVEPVRIRAGDRIPTGCDVYLIGGSEDGPQPFAAARLAGGELAQAVDRGAAVLAVCSGLQLLGRHFPGPDGRPLAGLDLLPLVTRAPAAGLPRTVGDVRVRPGPELPIGDVIGFENHRGQSTLDPGASPLGSVLQGYGNDRTLAPADRVDGAVQGRVLGSYLHGPVLALNPALADLVLGWVIGPLAPLEDPEHERQVARARLRRAGLRTSRRHRQPRQYGQQAG
jgi:lipid II isoglutaminyl synthase (glutamine-hydrolysing)